MTIDPSTTRPGRAWASAFGRLAAPLILAALLLTGGEAAAYDCGDTDAMLELARASREGRDPIKRVQNLTITCDLDACEDPKEGPLFKARLLLLMDICEGVPHDEEVREGGAAEGAVRPGSDGPDDGEGPRRSDDRERGDRERGDRERGDRERGDRGDRGGRGRRGGRRPRDKSDSIATGILGAAQRRLANTGFFDEVEVKRTEVQGGYDVEFVLTGVVVVEEVDFEGFNFLSGPLLQSEVEKRLQIQADQPFKPFERRSVRVEGGERRVMKDKRELAVEDLFKQKGYFGSEVKIVATPLPKDPKRVNVLVKIEPGREMAVRRVYIKKNDVMTYNTIRGLLLKPIGWFGQYNQAKLTEGIEEVLTEFRKRGYYGARLVYKETVEDPDAEQEQVQVDIFVHFDEGPRWEVTFRGNKAFSETELREQLTFAETGYVDQVEIQNTRDALRSYYETAGYYFAKITNTKVDELGPRSRRIIFSIDEGPRAEVRAIDLEGVEAIDPTKIDSVLNTRQYGLFDVGGFLQRSQIEADLETISQMYKDRGYLDVNVPRWRLRVENERQDLYVTIVVEEGGQTTVSDMKLLVTDDSGAPMGYDRTQVDENELRERLNALRKDFGLSPDGRAFSLPWLKGAQGVIIDVYQEQGFPKVQVEARCRESGSGGSWSTAPRCEDVVPRTPEGCLPSTNQERAGLCQECPDQSGALCCRRTLDEARCVTVNPFEQIEVALLISPGRQLNVGEIFLKGNDVTRDDVILREMEIKTGDRFYIKKVLTSQSNVRNLQLFESVSIEAIGVEEDLITQLSERELASLIVTVEEGPSLFFEVTVGIESRNLLTDEPRLLLTLEPVITESNLFGWGKQLQFRFKYAFDPLEAQNNFDDAEEPWEKLRSAFADVDRLVAAEIVYRDPRLTVWRLDTTVSLFANYDYLGAEFNNLDKVEYGVRPTVRRTFEGGLWQYLTAQFALEVKRTTTRNREEDPRNLEGDRLFEPWRTTLTLSPRLTYDRRDSPINPKSDYVADLEFDFTRGIQDSPIRFIRVVASWAQYFSFPRTYPKPRRLVFAYGFQAGQVWPLAGTKEIPVDERFRLGGVSSLRGFADNSVGPRDINFQPLGGELLLVGHTELRFPLFGDFLGFYFYDAGILVDCLEEQSISVLTDAPRQDRCYEDIALKDDLRMSTGIGLRYLILSQIPVGVDYGMILNRQVGEEFGQLHINIGFTF